MIYCIYPIASQSYDDPLKMKKQQKVINANEKRPELPVIGLLFIHLIVHKFVNDKEISL